PQVCHVQEQLDRAVMAIRTFTSRPIGYEVLRVKPKSLYPVPGAGAKQWNEHIPIAMALLRVDEVRALQEYAGHVFAPLHPSLEMACRRLADAVVRPRARDKILDAVVGLEAILLAAAGKEEYRGELRYRFSINYSSLQSSPKERYQAFLLARNMYDLR